jgi:hypothetical protein
METGKAAEGELKVLVDKGYNIDENDLIRHNLVVFRCEGGPCSRAGRVPPPSAAAASLQLM